MGKPFGIPVLSLLHKQLPTIAKTARLLLQYTKLNLRMDNTSLFFVYFTLILKHQYNFLTSQCENGTSTQYRELGFELTTS